MAMSLITCRYTSSEIKRSFMISSLPIIAIRYNFFLYWKRKKLSAIRYLPHGGGNEESKARAESTLKLLSIRYTQLLLRYVISIRGMQYRECSYQYVISIILSSIKGSVLQI